MEEFPNIPVMGLIIEFVIMDSLVINLKYILYYLDLD